MAINAYLFGNWKTDDPSKVIMLGLSSVYVGTGNYTTLMKAGNAGAVAYQVTAGKTLYIYSALLTATAAGNSFDEIGYGDGAVANSVSKPANPVGIALRMPLAINTPTLVPFGFIVPATKYPYASIITNSMTMIFYCEEK